MKRVVISALLLLLLLLIPVSTDAKRDVSRSVVALQTQQHETFCTAFSINERESLYLTAGHCVAHALQNKMPMTIKGGWAVPVMVRFGDGMDIAIVQGQFNAPALWLGQFYLAVGAEVTVLGYPEGVLKVVETRGHLAAKSVPLSEVGMEWPISDVLDITCTHGSSGSPVLNKYGDVIGLVWGGSTTAPYTFAIPHETVYRMVGGYFGMRY